MATTPRRTANRLILVTDAHVGADGADPEEFFGMLARLAEVDGDIVFLGDIFDLWIAFPAYETEVHRRFLAWCRRQRATRRVGFMEGNHEFFVAVGPAAASFTWCTDRAVRRQGEVLLVHGDRIDRRDLRHLAFRGLSRSRLARGLLRTLPAGPRIARAVKRRLDAARTAARAAPPLEAIRRFAARRAAEGSHTILVGHFHHEAAIAAGGDGGALYLLPAWRSGGRISLYEPEGRRVSSRHWREIA